METTLAAPAVRRVAFEPKTLVAGFTLCFLALVVLYPVAILVANSFLISKPHEATRWGFDAWRFAVTDPGMLRSLWNTLLVAVARQGLSLPLAIFFAWLIARTNMPGGRRLEFLFWVAFFFPSIPAVQAWILLLDPGFGLVNHALAGLPFVDKGPFNIYSFWGIVWLHLVTNTVAIKVMLLTPAFRNLDASMEEASMVAGASSLGTLLRVTVPVLTPTIVTVFVLAFIRAFQSVEIELVLGLPINFFVFGSKIFDLTRLEPPMYGAATAMSVTIVLVMIPLILLHRRLTGRRDFTVVTSRYKPQVLDLGGWKWAAFGLVLAFGLLITVVPFVSLVMGTFMKLYGFFDVPDSPWTIEHWNEVLSNPLFRGAVLNTLYLSAGGATISVVFFALLGYVLVRIRFRFRSVADSLTWVPHALPGIILVLAWFWIILKTPFLRPLFGTLWALILVSSLSGVTLGVQIVKTNVLQLGAELEEASYTAGASWWTTFQRVVVPLLFPTLVVLWILHFVSAAASAIMPALLAGPASRPLALLQLEYILAGRSEPSSVVGVLVVIFTVGLAVLARALGLRIGLSRVAA
jgi:iron(III) transport system permease protein